MDLARVTKDEYASNHSKSMDDIKPQGMFVPYHEEKDIIINKDLNVHVHVVLKLKSRCKLLLGIVNISLYNMIHVHVSSLV